MDDDDVKRNILVSILVLIIGVAFIIVDIFYLGSVIDFYQCVMVLSVMVIFGLLLIESFKQRNKRRKLLQEIDDELENTKEIDQ
ncbi:hypothetical protein [Lactococcus lactis]|uniref:hypothetical protein n=1 Tax=Lactococcus TaxID=1357 RepID=UPI00050D3445|nr:hypothetical protein [Lactococcus lactis]AIS03608.1 hypothetical protein LG36_1011 [Lactococcus lactis]MCQ4972144.1 hypothetical protein [Lactococcus lactis]MCQ4997950.1 hypothetical protein [Lactococcus lactis]MCT3131529.1 hypothetical protein [Lactococcus lactis]RHJ30023.1 hypothetical protein DW134_00225 [Lactococcus lactis]